MMALTIDHLMKIDILRSAKVIAGHNAMQNVIESVNVMDAPDIAEWVKPGELLLTTAYVIKDDPKQMISLIEQLKEKGCAALAVKTQRFISQFSEEVCQKANECEFPLIELPIEPSLGEVINQTVNLILNTKNKELENAFDAHRRFTHLMLNGGDMSDIAQTLGVLVGKEIVLLNPGLQIMGTTRNWEEQHVDLLVKYVWPYIENESLEPNDLSPIFAAESCYFAIYPVYSLDLIRGYIVLLFTSELVGGHDIPTMFLEQAGNVISYESVKQYAIEESTRRLQRQFFREFLEGRMNDEELLNRSKWYGLIEGKYYWVCVASVYQEQEHTTLSRQDEAKKQQIHDLLADQIKTFFRDENDVVTTTIGQHVVILLGYETIINNHEQSIIDNLTKLQKKITISGVRSTCSIGVGNFVDELANIPQSYREAAKALQLGFQHYAKEKKPFVRTFRTEEVNELMRMIPSPKLKQFCRLSLKQLAFPDHKEKQELLHTLQTYLDHHCQVTETAKQLYIHRNTVLYRVAKCEEILGVNLKEQPEESTRIRLALIIHSVVDNE